MIFIGTNIFFYGMNDDKLSLRKLAEKNPFLPTNKILVVEIKWFVLKNINLSNVII